MHFKSQKKIILIVSVLLLVFIIQPNALARTDDNDNSFASNYDRVYTLYVQQGYPRWSHRLYTSVPPSLYDYYSSRSHRIYHDSDYSKFVTPDAVRSIAENIQNVTGNTPYSDEQFANAVLMLVRQVSYVKSNAKYPVEAIIDNSGDCDVLSYLAASIMKAGGLDVVLLYYKGRSPTHMNVGVYLPYTPVYRTWWMTPKGYEYNGKKYWVAECTSQADWRVGDQPSKFAGAKAQIISLENCEKSSPAHVSSSLDTPLAPSSISINLSPEPSNFEERARTLNISGSISPAYPWQRVVMYVSQDGSSSNTFETVFTDNLGNYSLTWNFTSTGIYYIRTSWSGVSKYAASDSETLTVLIGLSQPLDEFEVPSCMHEECIARARAAAYNILISQEVKEFLKIDLLGEGVFLSGEFILLRSEKTIPRSEKTITIPSFEKTIPIWKGKGDNAKYGSEERIPVYVQTITITIPEHTITIPMSEQTTNYHLGLILQYNGENNYSVSVRVLDDYDLPQITKRLDGNDVAFINASVGTRENIWYKVVARMSEDETTAELYAHNGTLLQSIATIDDAISISELGILMVYEIDTIIAFKNLKVETLDQATPPVDENPVPAHRLEWRRGG